MNHGFPGELTREGPGCLQKETSVLQGVDEKSQWKGALCPESSACLGPAPAFRTALAVSWLYGGSLGETVRGQPYPLLMQEGQAYVLKSSLENNK